MTIFAGLRKSTAKLGKPKGYEPMFGNKSTPPIKAPIVIPLQSYVRQELRKDQDGYWELCNDQGERIRYLNMFERNFVESTIAACLNGEQK